MLCHGAGGGRHRGAPWGDPKALLGSGMAAGGVFESLWRVGPEGFGMGRKKGGLWLTRELGGSWGSLRLRGGLH